MKKAQGLPLETIVIIIIALVLLVVAIGFFTGSFSKLAGSTKALISPTSEADIIAAQNTCTQLCLQAGRVTTVAEFNRTSYCKRIFKFDLNGDGNITDEPKPNGNEGGLGAKCIADGDEYVCCRESPIGVPCNVNMPIGQVSESSC
jgi:hypothetical protein